MVEPARQHAPHQPDPDFVGSAQLRWILGDLHRDADVCRWLDMQGIPYFNGPGGPWTLKSLIEKAGMVKMGLLLPEQSTVPGKDKKKWLS